MSRTRKRHPPSLQAKVAVEAIKGGQDDRPDRTDVRRQRDPGRGWKRQTLAANNSVRSRTTIKRSEPLPAWLVNITDRF